MSEVVSDSPILDYPEIEYLVDEILPVGEVNLIAGSPGAGKTTLVLQSLRDFVQGRLVLGKTSHPAPIVYISLDRSYQLVCAGLRRAGIPPGTFPAVAAREHNIPYNISAIINWTMARYPGTKLIFIEAMGTLVPKGDLNDYHSVAGFLNECSRQALKHQICLWGSLHVAKTKPNEAYKQPRDKIMGSTAWTGFSATTILVEATNPGEIEDQSRTVFVLPREGRPYELRMTFTDSGVLVPIEDNAEQTTFETLDQELTKLPLTEPIKTSQLKSLAEQFSVPPRSAERWLKSCVERGLLDHIGRGRYHRLAVQ
jgi:hypothetical protein